MLSLQEKTADRSPPLSPPEGTAITSLSRPASSRDRCVLSLPAHNSMQPKGRRAVREHSSSLGSIFLILMRTWTFLGPCRPRFHAVQVSHSCAGTASSGLRKTTQGDITNGALDHIAFGVEWIADWRIACASL